MADPFARFGYKRPDEYLGDVGRGILSQYQDYFDPFTKDDSGKYYAEQPLAPPTEKTPQVTKDWLPNALAATDIASTVLPQGLLGKGALAAVKGVSAATNAVPGISLASSILGLGARRRTLPPVTEVFHGTGSPAEYVRPNLPPPEHDLGIHTSVNPNISASYAFKHDMGTPDVDFMSGKRFDDPDAAGPRLKSFLMDARKALVYPQDAVKWNTPDNVVRYLADSMRQGFVAPRGLLSDMHNISASDKMWQDQFIPMLKDRGYDSMIYPHHDNVFGGSPYNSFMTFDPEQLTPTYSREGQQLAKNRGIKGAIKDVSDFDPEEGAFQTLGNWAMPKGILKKESEIESLVRLPSKNTSHWWENPNSPLSKIEAKEKADFEDHLKKTAEADKKFIEFHQQEAAKHGGSYTPSLPTGGPSSQQAALNMIKWEQGKVAGLFHGGKISKSEYDDKVKYFESLKDQYYGQMVSDSALGKPVPKNLVDLSKKQLVDEYEKGNITAGEYHDTILKQMQMLSKDNPAMFEGLDWSGKINAGKK